jgi:drug/metabolite transporter (DMT)-like permease
VLLAWVFLDEPLSWTLVLGALLVIAGVVLVSRSAGPVVVDRPVDPGDRRRGILLALLVSVLWAVGQVVLRPATEGVHSVVANSVRQPLGMLMLLVLTLRQGRWRALRKLDRQSWVVIGVASLVGTGVGSLFFVLAIQLAGVGRTAVLTSTAPLLAIPFSMLWLHERPTRWTLAGTMLTTLGIVLVV